MPVGGGRLVGWVGWFWHLACPASGSLPAMGCGGSKAQPTSEVPLTIIFSRCLFFFSFIWVRVQAIVLNFEKKCDKRNFPSFDFEISFTYMYHIHVSKR